MVANRFAFVWIGIMFIGYFASPDNIDGLKGVLSIGIFIYILIFLGFDVKKIKLKNDTEKQKTLYQPILYLLANGKLPETNVVQIILKSDETAYFAHGAALYETKMSGYTAESYSKDTILKIRNSRRSSTDIDIKEEFNAVATGEFAVTSHRVVFAGDKKSFSIFLDDLTNFNIGKTDGKHTITFHANTLAHVVVMDEMSIVVTGKILNILLKS